MIVDPFGGPGGWAEGLRMLGMPEVGIEWDPWACATRRAAGHPVIRADVTTYPIDHLAGRVEGLLMSPPCQAFSTAGKGGGRAEINRLTRCIETGYWAAPFVGAEVLEVGRWAETIQPTWIACEQVPPVLPLWRAYAQRWQIRYGWSCWAGKLNTADYGVPQTRVRAILIARTDGRPAVPPAATHTQRMSGLLWGELRPWASMADALGWTGEDQPARTVCGDRQPRWLYPDRDGTHGRVLDRRQRNPDGSAVPPVSDSQPAPTVTVKAGGQWVVRTGANSMVTGRTDDDVERYERPITQPAPTVDSKAGTAWTFSRPATTVNGDPRLSGTGRNDPEVPGSQCGEGSVKLTIPEGLILQGFRPDYPVQGNKTQAWQQIGNAVPPLLAAHVVAAVTGRPGWVPEELAA